MTVFYYDKTINGLLSSIFDAYKLNIFPDIILGIGDIPPLFINCEIQVETHEKKYHRVWNLLHKQLPANCINMLTAVWLSEEEKSDKLIFDYIIKAIDSQFLYINNLGDSTILEIHKLAKKVYKEGHSIKQFVRFQKTKDNIYFAPVSLQYNSLPLVINHFKNRFSSQLWIIYDVKRKYGFYFDKRRIVEISLDKEIEQINKDLFHEDEQIFQKLWKNYYKALTIKERINLKLQKQHMPKRYWKYLIEKQKI